MFFLFGFLFVFVLILIPFFLSFQIQEVCDFVSHIDGCAQFAEDFRTEEIDGQALMLIKEKHIVEILKTKWGMALKIFKKIDELKTAFHIS